jgi:hypothetical protein
MHAAYKYQQTLNFAAGVVKRGSQDGSNSTFKPDANVPHRGHVAAGRHFSSSGLPVQLCTVYDSAG